MTDAFVRSDEQDRGHSRRARGTPDGRLTVLFFDHTAEWSGGEIALFHLVRHLDASKYERVVALACDGPLRERFEEAGIETHVLPLDKSIVQTRKDSLGDGWPARLKAGGRTLAYARTLAGFLRRRDIDLIHTNSLKSDIIGGIAGRLARVPVLWHVRDRIEPDYLPGPAVRVFRALSRSIPHCVVANSRSTLETLHLPPQKHTGVVYSGLEPSAFMADSEPDSGSGPIVGIVGRITSWKGQHVFIEAAREVRVRFPNAKFQIIGAAMFGEEDYERQIREQVRSLGLEDCVEFLGFRKDVAQLMGRLNVLVHASTSPEPFGQVVTQGMFSAKPVVATRGGGVEEIVEDKVTGLLVPMGEAKPMAAAIVRVLADPGVAAAMGAAGRRRALERFTIAQTTEKLDALYAEMARRHGLPYPA